MNQVNFKEANAFARTAGNYPRSRRGVTLLELLVVLVIVTATALIVVPTLTLSIDTPSQAKVSPDEIVTQQTMTVVREALMGADGLLDNMAHKPEVMPRQVAELLEAEPPEHVKKDAPELSTYDPLIGIGWRGPYLMPTGRNKSGLPTVVDGWGNELQIQVDFDDDGAVDLEESRYARVVSPGPNGKLETPSDKSNMKPGVNLNRELTMEECGDDVVMFLRVPDFRQ